jgi:hypothetical protein
MVSDNCQQMGSDCVINFIFANKKLWRLRRRGFYAYCWYRQVFFIRMNDQFNYFLLFILLFIRMMTYRVAYKFILLTFDQR